MFVPSAQSLQIVNLVLEPTLVPLAQMTPSYIKETVSVIAQMVLIQTKMEVVTPVTHQEIV